MAATDDDLPEKLDKLHIATKKAPLNLNKNEFQLVCNPFFECDRESIPTGTDVSKTPVLCTLNCAQVRRRAPRVRRASEGMEDKRNILFADEEEFSRTQASSRVIKQSLKKSISPSAGASGQRKLILREPILKALQTCFRQQSSVRKSIVPSTTQSNDFSNQKNVRGLFTGKGINDFGDLINECQNLLTEDVEFSGQLNKLSLSMRNSKNFTTMQTSNKSPKHGEKLRQIWAYQKQKEISSKSVASETDVGCDVNSHCSHKSTTNVTGYTVSTSSSPEHASTSTRHSTSCSQQAGSSAACDDVTIDELASYFDTFVHIPKKMSSMAEMMYI